MANYTTSSGFSDLNGSMVVTNDNVDSYTSTTQGNGTVRNLGGIDLDFTVRFGTMPSSRTYHVKAKPSGNGFRGTANNAKSSAELQETWTATATTFKPAAKKASK